MAYDLLVGNETFNGVSKVSIRDKSGSQRHIYDEQGVPIEIQSETAMASAISTENVGKVVKFVGVSTEKYTKDNFYSISAQSTGRDVVKISVPEDFVPVVDNYGAIMTFPFINNFTEGQAINVVYSVDGVINTKQGYFRTIDVSGDGSTILQTILNDPVATNELFILQEAGDDRLGVMMYLNYRPDFDTGGILKGQLYVLDLRGKYTSIKQFEIISIGNRINPASAKMTSLFGLSGLPIDPTPQDIADNRYAYDSKGNVIVGELRNPIEIKTESEMDAIAGNNNGNGRQYYRYVGQSGEKYQNNSDYAYTSVNDKGTLSRVVTLSDWAGDMFYNNERHIKILGNRVREYCFYKMPCYIDVELTIEIQEVIDGSDIWIEDYAFYGISALKRLIIRSTSPTSAYLVPTALEETGITESTGEIFVPDNLVDIYKASDSWSTYSNIIRPLSTLTE